MQRLPERESAPRLPGLYKRSLGSPSHLQEPLQCLQVLLVSFCGLLVTSSTLEVCILAVKYGVLHSLCSLFYSSVFVWACSIFGENRAMS